MTEMSAGASRPPAAGADSPEGASPTGPASRPTGAPTGEPSGAPVDVSLCIANWNGGDLLLGCLDSIRASDPAVVRETIVIDNASSDGSLDRVAREHPDVITIRNAENRGYAGAVNRGLERARGRYVLVLNNDTLLAPDTLREMTAYMDRNPEVGLAACMTTADTPAGRPVPCTNLHLPGLLRVTLENLAGLTGLGWLVRRIGATSLVFGYDGVLDQELRVAQVSGAFMFVRRQALEEVGPMDEGYFLYLEETDWCLRMARAGWQIGYHPGARVVHLMSRSTSRLDDRHAIYRKSMERYLAKHHGRMAAGLYRIEERLLDLTLRPLHRLARGNPRPLDR